MRITVRFHGLLGKLCPGEHVVEANNAYEALRIVCRNNEKKLTRKNGHKFDCFCKQVKTQDDLYRRGGCSELDVMPAFAPAGSGSTKSAWLSTAIVWAIYIIIVAIAAVVGLFAGGPAGAAAAAIATAEALLPYALTMTAGVWVSAIAQHFQKKSKPDQNETVQNYAFGMNGNTTKVGTAIPVGYGRYRVYGHLLSWATQTTGAYINGDPNIEVSEGAINQW